MRFGSVLSLQHPLRLGKGSGLAAQVFLGLGVSQGVLGEPGMKSWKKLLEFNTCKDKELFNLKFGYLFVKNGSVKQKLEIFYSTGPCPNGENVTCTRFSGIWIWEKIPSFNFFKEIELGVGNSTKR